MAGAPKASLVRRKRAARAHLTLRVGPRAPPGPPSPERSGRAQGEAYFPRKCIANDGRNGGRASRFKLEPEPW